MIPRLVSGLAQGLLFLTIFAVGSFFRPLHLAWNLTTQAPGVTRYFIPDGLLLALGAALLLLLISMARGRLRSAGSVTGIALALALTLGLLAKLGFVTKGL